MSIHLTATRREACGDLGKSIPDRRQKPQGRLIPGRSGSSEKAHAAEAERATGG